MDNSYGLAEIQEHLLAIMDDIDRVCRKYGIEYTLSDGTLIGAIRHKGFIPWDDDMDIMMRRSDFERFVEVYPGEMRSIFKIGHVCNLASYSIINTAYKIATEEKKGTISNPWITIFPYDNAPDDNSAARKKATKLRLLSGMMGKPPQYPHFSIKTKCMWMGALLMGAFYGRNHASRTFRKLCLQDNDKKTKYVSSYTCNTKYIYRRYNAEYFQEYKDVSFEDRTYRVIVHYHDFLTDVYGDYMTPMPPQHEHFTTS